MKETLETQEENNNNNNSASPPDLKLYELATWLVLQSSGDADSDFSVLP